MTVCVGSVSLGGYPGPELGKQGVMTPAGLVPAYDQQQSYPQADGRGVYLPALYAPEPIGNSNAYMDQNYGHTNENIQGRKMPSLFEKLKWSKKPA